MQSNTPNGRRSRPSRRSGGSSAYQRASRTVLDPATAASPVFAVIALHDVTGWRVTA